MKSVTIDYANLREAIRLLNVYNGGRGFDIWKLSGPAKATCRAHLMSVLCGQRMPQSKSGVTAIRDTFYAVLLPTGDTIGRREESFERLCHMLLYPEPVA